MKRRFVRLKRHFILPKRRFVKGKFALCSTDCKRVVYEFVKCFAANELRIVATKRKNRRIFAQNNTNNGY